MSHVMVLFEARDWTSFRSSTSWSSLIYCSFLVIGSLFHSIITDVHHSDGILWFTSQFISIEVEYFPSCTSWWSCSVFIQNPPRWGRKDISMELWLSWITSHEHFNEICCLNSKWSEKLICFTWLLLQSLSVSQILPDEVKVNWHGVSPFWCEAQIMFGISCWCDIRHFFVKRFLEWSGEQTHSVLRSSSHQEDLFKYKSSMMRWHKCVSVQHHQSYVWCCVLCVLEWCDLLYPSCTPHVVSEMYVVTQYMRQQFIQSHWDV